MKKKAITVLIAILVMFTASILPAYADEHHMDHGSKTEANVSEEVDRASGGDNDMETQYFMYIPPKLSATDVPKMGDAGIDINILLMITIGIGVTYLGCHYYAYKDS